MSSSSSFPVRALFACCEQEQGSVDMHCCSASPRRPTTRGFITQEIALVAPWSCDDERQEQAVAAAVPLPESGAAKAGATLAPEQAAEPPLCAAPTGPQEVAPLTAPAPSGRTGSGVEHVDGGDGDDSGGCDDAAAREWELPEKPPRGSAAGGAGAGQPGAAAAETQRQPALNDPRPRAGAASPQDDDDRGGGGDGDGAVIDDELGVRLVPKQRTAGCGTACCRCCCRRRAWRRSGPRSGPSSAPTTPSPRPAA